MIDKNQNQYPKNSDISEFSGDYTAFSDGKLVELVKAGNERAFEQIMTRYIPIVTAFLWGKMWERDEIADLTQEIFIRAYTKICQLRDANRFNTWVLGIARHTWVDYCRNPDTQNRKRATNIDDLSPGPRSKLVYSGSDSDQSVANVELRAIVRAAIGGLTERYRLVLYLRLIDEKSNQEIAQLTGLRENAVRTRISRGLNILRKSLIRKGIEPF